MIRTTAGPPHIAEASVAIEGVDLTFGQSMTLRVAICHFMDYLASEESEGLGDIRDGYKGRTREILALIERGAR